MERGHFGTCLYIGAAAFIREFLLFDLNESQKRLGSNGTEKTFVPT